MEADLHRIQEIKTEELPEEDFSKIITWISTCAGKELIDVLELVGDLCRIDENRLGLGEAIEKLVEHLDNNDVNVTKFAARALGNLSYEQADHIAKICDLGAAPKLIALLSVENEDQQRNAAGALANLASQCEVESINDAIIGNGALLPAMALFKSPNQMVQYMALRLLINLCDRESNHAEIDRANGLDALSDLLDTSEFANVKEEVINAINLLTENKQLATKFISGGGLQKLLSKLQEEEEEVQEAIGKLIVSYASREELRALFSEVDSLKDLLAMAHSDDTVVLKYSIQTISQLALDEENVGFMLKHLDSLVGFLTSPQIEVQVSGAMMVANIARTDENCAALMDSGVLKPLLDLMDSPDAKLQHLVTAGIRNLAIPPVYKKQILDAGIMPTLIKFLTHQNAHVMFSSILTIKSLMAIDETREVFISEGGLEPLVKIKDAIIINPNEDKDKPKDRRIQLEAARLLTLLTQTDSYVDSIVELGGIGLLKFLFESHFDILHCEGMEALHRLASNEEHVEEMAKEGVIEPVVSLLTRAEEGSTVPVSVLKLLTILASNERCKEAMVASKAAEILANVAEKNSSNAEMVSLCDELKNKL